MNITPSSLRFAPLAFVFAALACGPNEEFYAGCGKPALRTASSNASPGVQSVGSPSGSAAASPRTGSSGAAAPGAGSPGASTSGTPSAGATATPPPATTTPPFVIGPTPPPASGPTPPPAGSNPPPGPEQPGTTCGVGGKPACTTCGTRGVAQFGPAPPWCPPGVIGIGGPPPAN